jgi:putative endonuclease
MRSWKRRLRNGADSGTKEAGGLGLPAFLCDVGHLREGPATARMAAMNFVSRVWLGGLERGMAGLDRMVPRRNTKPVHLRTGLAGEDAAYFYLRRKGYTVVARRWSPGHQPGDLDLIAWLGELLCVVEVKSRTAHDMTPAEAAVDTHKRKMMRRLARQYVRQLPMEVPPQVRFDVISVYLVPGQPKEFVHFEAAFGWNDLEERF